MIIKKISLSLIMLFVGLSVSAQKADTLLQQKNILKTMNRVANWQLNNWTEKGFKHKKYDWTNATCYAGLFELGKMSKNDTYLKYLIGIGNDLNWNTGPRRSHADDYCIAQTYSHLYMKYHDAKMIAKFRAQADSIVAAPHTEGCVER